MRYVKVIKKLLTNCCEKIINIFTLAISFLEADPNGYLEQAQLFCGKADDIDEEGGRTAGEQWSHNNPSQCHKLLSEKNK